MQRELDVLRNSDKQLQEKVQSLKTDKQSVLNDRNQLRRDLDGMKEDMTTSEEKIRALHENSTVRDRELELLRKIRDEQRKKIISSCNALFARDAGSLLKMTFSGWHLQSRNGKKQRTMKTAALAVGQTSNEALRSMCFGSWKALARERALERRQKRKEIQRKVGAQMLAIETLVPVLFGHWRKEVNDPKAVESLAKMQAQLHELQRKLVRKSGEPARKEDVQEQILTRFAAEFFFEDQGLLMKCFFSWHYDVSTDSRERLRAHLKKMEEKRQQPFCGCMPKSSSAVTSKIGRGGQLVRSTFFANG